MPRLTEYELERLANIERNNELLKSLGIFKAEVAPSKLKEVRVPKCSMWFTVDTLRSQKAKAKQAAKENSSPQSSRKRRQAISSSFIAPRRKSARLSRYASGEDATDSEVGNTPLNSDPIDFLPHSPRRSPRKHAVALKKISPPPIPEQKESEEDEELDPEYRAPLPTRDADSTLRFSDAPHFNPNMTPEEILRAGSFGGTVFQYVFLSGFTSC